MFDFHTDKPRYFEMQRRVAAEHVLPMVARHVRAPGPWRVLEVGCAEAGVLKAFLDAGHVATGIELLRGRAELAEGFLAEEIAAGRARIRADDVYDVEPGELEPRGFDVIVLKDVIEHIPHQERMVPRLAEFLAPGGRIFFGFPPWRMPFGGHQQIARSAAVSRVPWLHLLPRRLYAGYVAAAGERARVREELADIHNTRISIGRFERIVAEAGLSVEERVLWLTNPIYAHKFGLAPRRQLGLVSRLPGVRDFVSTAAYYIIGADDLRGGGPTDQRQPRAHATVE